MKITKVDVMLINPKAEDNKPWTPVGIRIYTDAGIYGDGEAAMAYGSISRGAYGAVIDFSEKIIGKDPLDTEVIWEDLYKSTLLCQSVAVRVGTRACGIDDGSRVCGYC